MRDYKEKEYYIDNPKELELFDCTDWVLAFDDVEIFDIVEDMEIIEKRGGKLSAHHLLLERRGDRLSDSELKYLQELNKNLTLTDMKLLEYCGSPNDIAFDVLAINVSSLTYPVTIEKMVDSIEKYNVKRFALYDTRGDLSLDDIRLIELNEWEIKGTITDDSGSTVALEFNKVDKED